jgi:carbon storage regulator
MDDLAASGVRRLSYMLVLTRKANQSIMIGDDIEVSVLSILGEKVRLGIQAPRRVPVFRKEVFLEIQAQSLEAAEEAQKAFVQLGEADEAAR